MTENKRFKVAVYDDGFQSIYDTGNDEYLTEMDLSKIEELLNELHDKYIDEYALRETLQVELQRVEEENKQLNEENEQLKQENQEFRKRTKELIAVSLDYPTINLDLIAEAIKSLRELIE